MLNQMLKQYPAAWVGTAVLVVMHFAGGGWWLDAADRVRTMVTALGVVAFAVGLASKNWNLYPALHLVFGSAIGMTIVLITTGGSNIWPIVIVGGAAIAIVAIMPPFFIGMLTRMGIDALRRRFA